MKIFKMQMDPKYIPITATMVVALLLYFAVGIRYPGFLSLQVFVNFLTDNAFLLIVAVGMTFVILSGGIDLSVGSMIGFTGIFTAYMIEIRHINPFLAMALALFFGSALGFIMGCMIHYFKSPPFIVTLTGLFLARGLANIISLESITINNPIIINITSWGIPIGDVSLPAVAIIAIMVFLMGVYIAHLTEFGRNCYAIGGNSQSALLMGLPVAKTKVGIYTLSGFLSALGGIVFTIYTSAGYGLSGKGLEMDAIASVVIGGTLLSGGVGFMAGTLVGVLIQGIIQTFISFEGTLSSWWTKIAIGLLLLLFILIQRFVSQQAERGDNRAEVTLIKPEEKPAGLSS